MDLEQQSTLSVCKNAPVLLFGWCYVSKSELLEIVEPNLCTLKKKLHYNYPILVEITCIHILICMIIVNFIIILFN